MAETAQIAEFAAGLRFQDIPQPVWRKALDHVIDAIGCGLAGAGSSLSRQFLHVLSEEAGPGPCSVMGTTRSFGPGSAAFANAMAINALDFDDGLEEDGKGLGHPGATIIAAAISAAFLRPVSGRDFLTAVVAGYEVNARLIRAIQPGIQRFRLVYGVCQHQGIGGAAAFGRLMGLDAAGMANALGFAGTLANVPSLRKYNWDSRPLVSFKDFVAPAAESAVRAVRLHQGGMIGAANVLDGETGLWRMLGSDRYAPDLLTDGLGRDWSLDMATIKPWPTCRWMHCTLASLDALMRDHGVGAGNIERITLHVSDGLLRDFMQVRPATMVDAQFSLPYAIAAMLQAIPPAQWYAPDRLSDPALLALAARVSGETDPKADAQMHEHRRPAGRVSVVLRDGRQIAAPLICYPPGSRQNPLPEDFVGQKFRDNLAGIMPQRHAQETLDAFLTLQDCDDVAAVLRPLLTGAELAG
ncbi:MmgE/PrpD family protein [Paracoccus shanxieyensis]|uniref:MmgE/PrpD family protein n=1 Tax=Paracoccus shanxieyensis TaxID=2675752 RepID=A0A6L6IW40_9RHOB|nr:MmgE/PrpD family protein [Paracoccus shanxieyensis]MTH64119.1 mmgE/PrpD family protein [Paracoccus shanxieyensis]MTH87263.1 mmgE/PrpD family protein [Paracoccus shanxieyensis]